MSSSPPTDQYAAEPTRTFSFITPRFWHGMGFPTWMKLLARNRYQLSVRGLSASLGIFPSSIHNSFWATVQSAILGSKIDRVELTAQPLFVLGHWRSGTTLLHELLIRDPELTFPDTYECFCPQHFLLTKAWLMPATRWLVPKQRPMDNVAAGWERPQEDEFALCNLGSRSPYLCWAFPDHGPIDSEYLTLEGLNPAELTEWKARLLRFVKSIAYSRNRQVVLKSPPHTARVKTLLEIFPDAKFIHIARDPVTLFPSTVRLWKALCDVERLQKYRERYDWIEEEVLSNLTRMYDAYERDRQLIPPGQLIELRYEDLVADTRGSMQRIYSELDLGDFGRVEPALEEYLQETRDYKTNRYKLPEEIESMVRARWGKYFEMFGYN